MYLLQQGEWGRVRGSHRTSENNSSHVGSSWRLNELTVAAVTIEMESLFQSVATCILKKDFLRRRRPGPTLKGSYAWLHWRTKTRLGSKSNSPENILYAAMRSSRVRRLFKDCRPSPRSRSSYGSRRNPLPASSQTA